LNNTPYKSHFLNHLYKLFLCLIFQIGYTTKTTHDRAKELKTGLPCAYDMIYDIHVKNPRKYESIIHSKLKNYRVYDNREFFRCEPNDIIEYFKMENLIESETERSDFYNNYFKKYGNNEDNEDNEDIEDNEDNEDNKNIKNIKNIKNKDKIIIKKNVCNKCDKAFPKNYLLQRHLNRKYPCVTNIDLIDKKNDKNN